MSSDLPNIQAAASQPPRPSDPSAAPWYNVPQRAIVNVEHICIIQNVERAIDTLGGIAKVQQLLGDEGTSPVAQLYLHPGDRMCNPILSKNVGTNNILLQVTVPKRTGRKRKRGSLEPYQDAVGNEPKAPDEMISTAEGAQYLLHSTSANVGKYRIRPVGLIEQTHRFRGLPDFVWSTTNSPFMQKMREHIYPLDYEKMKSFKFDLSRGPKPGMDLIPPPSFTRLLIPFNYGYHQNPAVRRMVDAFGNVTTFNTQVANKILTQMVTYDVESVPAGPRDDLEPIDILEPLKHDLIERLRQLLEERPIWTRRAIGNRLAAPGREWNTKHIYQYAGYMFRSGPWRDAVVKFGVDPRSDPKYRIYQTMTFQIDEKQVEDLEMPNPGGQKPSRKAKNSLSHLFDGKTVVLDGKVWQVCDVVDPLLKSLLDTDDLRDECHIKTDGWYHNGTWAKVRVIMKAKLAKILAGEGEPNDMDYEKIAALPETIDKDTRLLAVLSNKKATKREVQWAADVRTIASAPQRVHRAEGDDGGQRSRTELEMGDGVIDRGTDIDPGLAYTITQEVERSGLLDNDGDAAIGDMDEEMEDDGIVGFGNSDEDMEGDSSAEEEDD
ncbi:Transcription factor IIIC, subunit 5 [Lasallia pustulata]|uniref:Transcription factor IIIC, subunit 5 n=1 Tax=Lasallia pustulata TaxID=136370 RepID=A0A1W5CVU5_9LECA|nr:Transcription factor IIIC, subunit 5 [Lasallia pustulata]